MGLIASYCNEERIVLTLRKKLTLVLQALQVQKNKINSCLLYIKLKIWNQISPLGPK